MNESNGKQAGRREENRRSKMAAIESAGRQLFDEKGFEETTTRELARSAGVGTGTLFLYFPEKRDLLLHLFHRDVVDVNAQAFATRPERGGLVEQACHVFQRCYDYYERDLRLSRSLIRELLFAEPDARRRHSDEEGFIARLVELAEEAQRRSELRSELAPRRVALLFLNVYVFGLISWLLGSTATRDAADELVRENLELCLRGLAPERA